MRRRNDLAGQAATAHEALLGQLRAIVGARHVLTRDAKTRGFATGYRTGGGPVMAVVRPGSLVEQWRVLQACVRADRIVITQASNTGLTGGSTPHGRYDRDVVIVNTTRIDRIHLLRAGRQAVCLAGATLYALERRLRPLGREPHSVIGSSCIGASVVGGVCNNSGGALVRRGPAYTEYALYAQVTAEGAVVLRNRLGIALGEDPETILARLEAGDFGEADIEDDDRVASLGDYPDRLRDVDTPSPARFNADPAGLYEVSGSAGRLMVFAVRLDTFPADDQQATFYIGTNDPGELTRLRRRVLTELKTLPVSGEYIHRGAFDLAAVYGKDVFLAIQWLGADRLPGLFALKNRIDAIGRRLKLRHLSDRLMQGLANWLPQHLPRRMLFFRDLYQHHLVIKTSGDGIAEMRALLASMFPTSAGEMFECSPQEATQAFLHRFAVAGAAVRYRAVHADQVEDIVALDLALRRNDEAWFERLPDDVAAPVIAALYYGHFFCHVFHQDYIVRKGTDVLALEHRMWALLDARGAEYPAEHNVGHLYVAKPALAAHYRALDPGNRLNPGIGHTCRDRGWGEGVQKMLSSDPTLGSPSGP